MKALLKSLTFQIAKDMGWHPKSLKAQRKAREVIREMFRARNQERESIVRDTNELLRDVK